MSNTIPTLPRWENTGHTMQQIVADNLAAEVARRRLTGRKLAQALGLGQMYVARRPVP